VPPIAPALKSKSTKDFHVVNAREQRLTLLGQNDSVKKISNHGWTQMNTDKNLDFMLSLKALFSDRRKTGPECHSGISSSVFIRVHPWLT